MSDEQVSNGLTWLIEQQKDEIAELERQLKISQECRDGWQWVKDKLIACVPELTLPQRDDSLAGTKYEVMGWMHVLCGYAQSANHTYLSIAVEQQKRAEEAEVEIHRLTARLAEVEAEKASIVEGLHREIIAACQNCAAGNEPSPNGIHCVQIGESSYVQACMALTLRAILQPPAMPAGVAVEGE